MHGEDSKNIANSDPPMIGCQCGRTSTSISLLHAKSLLVAGAGIFLHEVNTSTRRRSDSEVRHRADRVHVVPLLFLLSADRYLYVLLLFAATCIHVHLCAQNTREAG